MPARVNRRPHLSSSCNEPAAGRSRAASQPDAKSDSEIFNKFGPASGAARLAEHIPKMQNVRTKIPMVEVTAPDGGKSLWVAAVAKADAVAAVEGVIPANFVATLSRRRLTLTRNALRPGEVRRVRP